MYSENRNCNPNYQNWTDSAGFSCATYKANKWCSWNMYGPEWDWINWGTMNKYTNGGYSGLNCPQCGCRPYG